MRATINDVIAAVTLYGIIAVTARQRVIARTAQNGVFATKTFDAVIVCAARQMIVTIIRANKHVVSGFAKGSKGAGDSVDPISTTVGCRSLPTVPNK